jgi:APA family basic amino acid/polyamine antiporter
MFPKAGGQYVYIKEAIWYRFLYGWSFFAVIQTGTIAAVGWLFPNLHLFVSSFSDKNILLELETLN